MGGGGGGGGESREGGREEGGREGGRGGRGANLPSSSEIVIVSGSTLESTTMKSSATSKTSTTETVNDSSPSRISSLSMEIGSIIEFGRAVPAAKVTVTMPSTSAVI